MDVTTEILIKGCLTVVALVAVIIRHRRPGSLAPEQAGTLLWMIAVIAVLAWPNFGRLHGTSGIHHWEQFHYFLGSKYFPELEYDGIYAASLAAELELDRRQPLQSHVRDLRDNRVVPIAKVAEHRREVKNRFSKERWQLFVADVEYFLESNRYDYISRIRLDHGYNPTPTWTFVARVFSSFAPASDTSLTALAWLDPLLLGLMFWTILRTFGSRTLCLSMIVFGLGYPWRFDWVGGAFLRQDWLVAVGIAVCFMKKERNLAAGMLIAYATMVRVFPGAFLIGPAVVAVRCTLRERRIPAWTIRLGSGFVLGVILCLAAGSLTGSGPAAWFDFRDNLEKHHGTWLTNNVGLQNLLLYDRATLAREDVDFNLPEPWLLWQAKMDRLQGSKRSLIIGAAGLLLLVIALASWQLQAYEAAVLGVAATFAAVVLTCYYWVMMCLLPVGKGRWGPTAGWLALNLGLYALHLVTPAFEMIYGAMSLALLVFFLAWMGPDALTTLRGIAARGRS